MNSHKRVQPKPNTFSLAKAICYSAVAILAMWHVWQDILTIAMRDAEASHILLVPFVFAWLLWVRRDSLFSLDGNRWIGIILIATGIAFHEIGLNYSIVALFHLSAVVVMIGGICLSLGHKILWRLCPAFVALLFLVPVPGLIRQQLSTPIQYFSATVASYTLGAAGLPIEQNGFILSLDGTEILIAEACNGMRMLFAVLLSVFAFCFSLKMNRATRFWILFSLPAIALIVNCLRILATVLLFAFAPESYAIAFHDLSGWVVPVLVIVCIASVPKKNTKSSNDYVLPDAAKTPKHRRKLGFLPGLTGLLLLGIVFVVNTRSFPNQKSVAKHHDLVKDNISAFPYAFGDWVAVDKPLHKEEIDLLKPNVAFRRTYLNLKTSHTVTVFAIACKHTRDLVGHEPGICYVAQGWDKSLQANTEWDLDDLVVHGREFEFTWPKSKSNQKTNVKCVLVAPDGSTTGNTYKLAEFASDYRLERFGAASIQMSNDGSLTKEEWMQTSREIVSAFAPVIKTFQNSSKTYVKDTNLTSVVFSNFTTINFPFINK